MNIRHIQKPTRKNQDYMQEKKSQPTPLNSLYSLELIVDSLRRCEIKENAVL